MLAVIYLLEDKEEDKTEAYYCLLNDKIELDPDEKSKWNKLNRKIPNSKRYHAYPVVKIGRLGVSMDYAHQHIGQMVIMQIKMIFSRMNRSGCRFLTVDAYAESVPFYEKCGSHCLSDKDETEETRAMYFDLMYYKKYSSATQNSAGKGVRFRENSVGKGAGFEKNSRIKCGEFAQNSPIKCVEFSENSPIKRVSI